LIPAGRPSQAHVFGAVRADYKLVLNLIAGVVFVALFGLTVRRGATDPVCGMQVDRRRALRATVGGRSYYFCCEGCRARFEREAGPTT